MPQYDVNQYGRIQMAQVNMSSMETMNNSRKAYTSAHHLTKIYPHEDQSKKIKLLH